MKFCGNKCFMESHVFSIYFYILSLILHIKLAPSCNVCANEYQNLLVPPGYNKYKTPFEEENKTTYVYVNLDIMDIDEILEEKMEYSMKFYVNEYWKDERLNMSYFIKYRRYQVPRVWVEDLWVPDIIFENSKGGWIYQFSVPNTVVQVHSSNYLHRFTRYSMKVTCSMYLQSYPMDTQNCFFHITSLAYDNSKMMLRWLHEREEDTENIQDLTLADVSPLKYYVANITPGTKVFQWPSGSFTALYANFTFVRHLSSHIMNVYIPSGLVVVLSFLSFWLDVRSVPARVALGLTSLLTLSTQAFQARTHLPPINYLTALDVWLFTCMILVFLSLVEYATVYHLHNEKVRKNKQTSAETDKKNWAKRCGRNVVSNSTTPVSRGDQEVLHAKEMKAPKNKETAVEFEDDSQYLDKISRLLFPLSYLIFSAVYWIIYLGVL